MKKRRSLWLKVECGYCTGHGMGGYGPDSACSSCKGRGYFEVDRQDPEWRDHCEENDIDPDTGEELETKEGAE